MGNTSYEDYGVAIFKGVSYVDTQRANRSILILEYGDKKRLLVPVYQLYKIAPYEGIYGVERQLDRLDKRSWKELCKKLRKGSKNSGRPRFTLCIKRDEKRPFISKDGEMAKYFEGTLSSRRDGRPVEGYRKR